MHSHPAFLNLDQYAELLRYPRAVELQVVARRHDVRRSRISRHILEVRRRQGRTLLKRTDECDGRVPVNERDTHTGPRQSVPRSQSGAARAWTGRGGAVIDQYTAVAGDSKELAVATTAPLPVGQPERIFVSLLDDHRELHII